jgi:hypothetical protein
MRNWALAAVALLAACAKDYVDLTPFPCPADHQCPAGLACVAGVGCTTAALDAFCDAATDCTEADKTARCGLGLCLTPCHDGAGCLAGRVCSAASGAGFCVTDCTVKACPSDLECAGLWYQGHKGCLSPGTKVAACASVTIGDQCPVPPPQCNQANFTVTCDNGNVCAANSICTDPTNGHYRCKCNDGFDTVNCAGEPCTVTVPCLYPSWGCRPQSTPGCNDSISPVSGTCRCIDGRDLDVQCGAASTCEMLCQK